MNQPTYGISIGRDNHGAVAAGDHAQAVQNTAAPAVAGVESILAELAKIRAVIENDDGVTDRHKAVRDVDALLDEVRQDDPDTDAIRAAFLRLIGRVTPVAAVAAAVYQVWALVENMVGGA
ncbi:hypothetical protein Ais01nite_16650 [Asanoa ishikariensis]|uniref:Uncharacterized protein n=1 Tax=Asanoa ishikariensis TaxID=137265 RepID=A0A1H3UHW1_9ACTN|nr:DUF5955 family protein [Asanoa ishikariensis]GIF63630.1 hypothetical protein Ais01nite_16650 [Asanoa ishikariensis]SDZ61219.1 hypothetical protein SAMN05421684_7208 [Asanoa ishikariensis]